MIFVVWWLLIATAMVAGQFIGVLLSTLIMQTRWYRRFLTKAAEEYTKDVMSLYYKEEEEEHIISNID